MNKISLPRIIVAGLLFIIGGILVFNVPIMNAYMKYQTSKFQIEHVSRKKIEVNSKKKFLMTTVQLEQFLHLT